LVFVETLPVGPSQGGRSAERKGGDVQQHGPDWGRPGPARNVHR